MSRFLPFLLAVLLLGAAWTSQSAAQRVSFGQATTPPQPSPSEKRAVKENLKDVHFAFDSSDLDDEARYILRQNADWLKANPSVVVSIAGNTDERGDITYNLALSQRRADATREALVSYGVPSEQIEYATGWGKLYPTCNESSEACWAQNRRVHTTAGTTLQTETVAQKPQSLSDIEAALCGDF
jgi:peptidoglycan-associated lipoprotein